MQEISNLLKVCGENYCTAPVGGVGVGLSPVRGTPGCSTLGGPTSAAGQWLCCLQGPPSVGVKGGLLEMLESRWLLQALDSTAWCSKWPLWVEEEREDGELQAFPGTGYVGFSRDGHRLGRLPSSTSSISVLTASFHTGSRLTLGKRGSDTNPA